MEGKHNINLEKNSQNSQRKLVYNSRCQSSWYESSHKDPAALLNAFRITGFSFLVVRREVMFSVCQHLGGYPIPAKVGTSPGQGRYPLAKVGTPSQGRYPPPPAPQDLLHGRWYASCVHRGLSCYPGFLLNAYVVLVFCLSCWAGFLLIKSTKMVSRFLLSKPSRCWPKFLCIITARYWSPFLFVKTTHMLFYFSLF